MSERHGRADLGAFQIQSQPDDETCGPTCLHAVYRHYGDALSFEEVLDEVPSLEGGGTLGVMLANHALARGYRATLISWNLQVFDPTWYDFPPERLRERLVARGVAKQEPKLAHAASAYVEFLDRGGHLRFRDLEPALLRETLARGVPILTGLSSTFLYRESRERNPDGVPDDVGGDPVGHFVVLTGYDRPSHEILVSDPMHPNPLSERHTYPVGVQRVIGAIYLGVLTYDANLVVIEPPEERR